MGALSVAGVATAFLTGLFFSAASAFLVAGVLTGAVAVVVSVVAAFLAVAGVFLVVLLGSVMMFSWG